MPRPTSINHKKLPDGSQAGFFGKKMSRETNSVLPGYALLVLFIPTCTGCIGFQGGIGHILYPGANERAGNQASDKNAVSPGVNTAIHKLLSVAQANEVGQVQGQQIPAQANICFVGIENRSNKAPALFKKQLQEKIDNMINGHSLFQSIKRNYVDANLRLTRLTPNDLSDPGNVGIYASAMEQNGQSVQYLLYGELKDATVQDSNHPQADYLLSLNLVEVASGQEVKETAAVHRDVHPQSLEKISGNDPATKSLNGPGQIHGGDSCNCQ